MLCRTPQPPRSLPRGRVVLLLVLAGGVVACARPAAPRLPEGEEYVFPSAEPRELTPEEARRVQKAWNAILTGDSVAAARDLSTLLTWKPGLVPVATALAYARLRSGRFAEAGQGFDGVLDRRPEYLPALVGAGSAAFRRGAVEEALGYFRRAQAVAPDDPRVRRRLGEVKLQVTERRVATAQRALEEGDGGRAIEEYRGALEAAPEVAGLRLELARLLVDAGDAQGAAAVLEADTREDRQVMLRLGEILSGLQEYPRALAVYGRLLARDPQDPDALRRSGEAHDAYELLKMPEEYRRIPGAPRITRADLAALVAVEVTALSRVKEREPKVAVDISGSWAREHIAAVLALDILDVYPNHTFQPAATVRRGDLARAVGRVLDLVAWPVSAGPLPTDMAGTHLYYDRVVRAVGAGLMDLTPDGAFEPWRPVSGREALDAVEALARLVGP
ncbi:MAG TPA: tetratricopeptide repeat protein [Vicinamibacteria bacterium]